MALTRILNNQVTDASEGNVYLGINAGTKIQNYSLTSGKLANNLVYASNLTVQGNLDVQGNTTTVDTVNLVVEDPLILLAKDQTGAPALDIGYIGQRGTEDNIAFAWIEGADEFATVFTDTTISNTTINIVSYANFHTFDANIAGNLNVVGNTTIADIIIGNVSITGSADVDGNISGGNINSNGVATITDTATVGNLSTAGTVDADGNISGGNVNSNAAVTTVTLTSTSTATVGNLSTAGTVDADGNISGGNVNSNNAVTTVTLTSTSTATVGNLSTAGTVSADGNIDGGNINSNNTVTSSTITATGNIDGGNLISQADVTTVTVTASGNISGANISAGSGTISTTGNIDGGNVNATANVTGQGAVFSGNVTADTFIGNIAGNIDAGGANTEIQFNDDDILNGSANFTFDKATNIMTVTGNIVGGNVSVSGIIDADGNISGGNLNANGAVTTVTLIATSTATVGNLSTAGTVTADGNITGGNLISNADISGQTLTLSGNASVGNLSSANDVDATGNVTAGGVITPSVTTASGDLVLNSAGGALQWDGAGNIVMNNKWINSLGTPSVGTDAATKQYVDDAVSSGIHIHDPVDVETPSPLPAATYAQGGTTATVTDTLAGNTVVFSTAVNPQVNDQYWFDNSFNGIIGNIPYFVVSAPNTSAAVLSTAYNGVPVSNITTGGSLTESVRINSGHGATLTANANGALTVDGYSVSAGNRVLVYEQLNGFENGIYSVTDTGNVTAPWILTRSTDANAYVPDTNDGIDQGSYVYVKFGDTGAGESYVMTAPVGPFIIGLGNIEFTQFSASQVYSANTAAGLVLNGTVFSAKVDEDTTAFDGGGNIIVKAGANLVTPNIGAATGTSLVLTGNISAGNASVTGIVDVDGNVTAGNVNANNAVTGVTLSMTSTATVGNLSTTGTVDATGNITGGNVNSNAGITGTTLAVTGNAAVGNLATENISATGDLSVGNITATGNIYSDQDITANATVFAFDVQANNAISAQETVSGNNINAINSIQGDDVSAVTLLWTLGDMFANGNITGGNVIANTAVFTVDVVASGNVDGANINATANVTGQGAVFSGNVTADTFIGNISGNIDAGGANTEIQFNDDDLLNGSANFTFDKATNTMTVTGNIVGGNVSISGIINADGNITGGNVNSNSAVTTVTLVATSTATVGNLSTAGTIDADGNISGGNLNSNGSATVTATAFLGNLEVTGTGNIEGKVIAGNALINSANTANAALAIGSTTSLLIPVGNTVQRPDVPVTGMVRFNTSLDNLEFYDNDSWTTAGSQFTVIVADQFVGNGVANTFTLTQDSSTAGTIVSINGIVQIPTTAYSVSGNVLTFTEAPEVSDVIDARILTTTTSVTTIQNASGNAAVEAVEGVDTVQITGNLLPAANVTYNLGSDTVRWNDIYLANSTIYLGNAQISANASSLILTNPEGATTVLGGTTPSISVEEIIKIGSNGVGNIGSESSTFDTVFAKATSAQYADLAEMYEADADYEPGTVLCFGGAKEVTLCGQADSTRVAGVVSTNPSYLMNSGQVGDCVVAVALTGRVPCRVTGTVRKGDLMVSTGDGRARANNAAAVGTVIGKALADFDGADGIIEVVVGRV